MRSQKFNRYCVKLENLFLFGILIILLIACRDGNASVTGKWELASGDTPIAGTGTLFEFFEDGTVTIDDQGTSYSWPDSKHIQIGDNARVGSVVFEYSLADDELILKTLPGETALLKRYEELSLSPSTLSGTWQVYFLEAFNDNPCLASLDLNDHGTMIFHEDGTVSIEASDINMLTGGNDKFALTGQFTISGNLIRMSLSGEAFDAGLLPGLGSTREVRGNVECSIATLSHSRLVLGDGQGESALYVRAN